MKARVVLLEQRNGCRCFAQQDLEQIFAQCSLFSLIVHRLVALNVPVEHLADFALAPEFEYGEGRDFAPKALCNRDGPARRTITPHESHAVQTEILWTRLDSQRRQKE